MLITTPDTDIHTNINAETNNERKNNSNNKLKRQIRKKSLISGFIKLSIIIACVSFSHGIYTLAKAQMAQYLLIKAWQTNNIGSNKPWPWADFYPVAKLSFDRFNVEQIVLNNDSGQALAFGPGLNPFINNSVESKGGVLIISAHNDTHFSLLKDLELNDTVSITFKSGITQQFNVNNLDIIDLKTEQLIVLSNNIDYEHSAKDDALLTSTTPYKELILVTCYPFGGVNNETSLRYIVRLS